MGMVRQYEALTLTDIRKYRGIQLRTLSVTEDFIPTYSGVYIWRYWPQPKSYSKEGVSEYLSKICQEYPIIEEVFKKNNSTLVYSRTPLGNNYKEPLQSLGLSAAKIKKFNEVLDLGDNEIKFLANTLEMMVYNLPPLYIGKASNLQQRLSQHLNDKTKLYSKIKGANMDPGDVYVSFVKDDMSNLNGNMADLLEIILQKTTNPIFTERQG